GFHGWDALTLGMTPATRLFPSGQAASYIDRILRREKPLPFQPGALPRLRRPPPRGYLRSG
ncbi:MAG: hypothetical protein WCA05_19830, partial [Pseudolabrys sp.]